MRSLVFALGLMLCPPLAATPALAGRDPAAVAKAHLLTGSRYFQQGDFAKALKEFEAGRKAKPMPALEYGAARCFEILERYDEAIAAYRLYLKEAPGAKDAEEVRQHVDELSRRAALAKTAAPAPLALPAAAPTPAPTAVAPAPPLVAAAPPAASSVARARVAPAPAPTVAAPPPAAAPPTASAAPPKEAAPPPATIAPPPAAAASAPVMTPASSADEGPARRNARLVKAGIALVAVGGAIAIAGGIGFGVPAKGASDALVDAANRRAAYDPSLQRNGQTYQEMMYVSIAAGSVVAVAGAVMAIIGVKLSHGSRTASVRLAPLAATRTAGVTLEGRF